MNKFSNIFCLVIITVFFVFQSIVCSVCSQEKQNVLPVKPIDVKELSDVNCFKASFDADRLIVVNFYSSWCRTCRLVEPVYEITAAIYSDKISFYAFDVDEYPDLGSNFDIVYLPTVYAINPTCNDIKEIPVRYMLDRQTLSKKLDELIAKFATICTK